MEIEYFVKPGEDDEWLSSAGWKRLHGLVHRTSGISQARPTCACARHADEELSHYAKATYDIEYSFAWGWGELDGHRQPHGLRPEGPRRAQRQPTWSTSTTRRTSTYRAVRGGAGRWASTAPCWSSCSTPTTRRTVEGDTARGAAPQAPLAGAGEGGGAAPEPQRAPGAQGPRGVRHGLNAPGSWRSTTTPRVDRPALPPPGRDRHPLRRHRGP